ncbi:MAG: PstS family phosphate ABC transporter substrate-binding protein [Gloeotrichia echinulata HAB0833]
MIKRNKKYRKKLLLCSSIMGLLLTVVIVVVVYWEITESENPHIPSQILCTPLKDISFPPLTIVPFGGSTTFAPINDEQPDKDSVFNAIKQVHPQFKLQHIDAPDEVYGSSVGIKWLIEGTHNLSFAQSSRLIKPEEFQEAEKRNFKLNPVPVAHDIITIYVNPKLLEQGLKGLTLKQLRNIFEGNVTNWQEVKGPDITITPFIRNPEKSGTAEYFQEHVMKNKPFGKGVAIEQTTTQTIKEVANNPGGISFASAPAVIKQKSIAILPISKQSNLSFQSPCADNNCKGVNQNLITEQSYPDELIRKLYVVIKQDNLDDQKAGEAYANMIRSCEGQQSLKNRGFIPIFTPSTPSP